MVAVMRPAVTVAVVLGSVVHGSISSTRAYNPSQGTYE
jgi:hypothetical protein